MAQLVALPASLITGWTTVLFIMRSITPLTVVFGVIMLLSPCLPWFLVAPPGVTVPLVSHLEQTCVHTLRTLLLDLLALSRELDRSLQR